MFNSAQDYLTLVITRDFVQAAIVGISNKTAEIKLFSEVLLEEGVIEDGVVYHIEGLVAGIQEAVAKLSIKNKYKTWVAIPDNKVLISHSHSIEKLEKKFDVSLDELSIIKTDNGITAMKKDTLDLYSAAVQKAGFEVQSVFPIASCLQSSLKSFIEGSTLVFYPFENSKLKFFLVNDKEVLLNSVMGHNILDKDQNLENGVKEIETYASSQTLIESIDRVVSISPNDSEELMELLPSYEVHTVKKDQDEIDNLPFLIIKGLIKKINNQQKGFMIDNILPKKNPKVTVVASSMPSGRPNSMRIGVIATVLTLLVMVLIGILIAALVNSRKTTTDDTKSGSNVPTVSASITVTPSPAPTATPTPIPTPVPTPTPVPLDQLAVAVLNGNGIAGDSERVRQVLLSKGFKNVQRDNAQNFDYSATEVLVKPNANAAGDTVVGLLKGAYINVVKKPAPANQKSDIVIILGAK